MKSNNFKVITTILTTGLFLFVFQNCGDDVSFDSGAAGVEKVDGAPVQISEIEVADDIEEAFEEIDIVDGEGESCDCDTEEQQEAAEYSGDGEEAGCSRRGGRGVGSTPGQAPSGNEVDGEESSRGLSRMCSIARLFARRHKVDGSSIKNVTKLRGVAIFGADELDSIENVRGNILVVGMGTESSRHIEKIENVRGRLIICGMSVGSMSNVRGTTVIAKGDIGDVEDHRGKLILLRSSISGDVSGIKGKLIQW